MHTSGGYFFSTWIQDFPHVLLLLITLRRRILGILGVNPPFLVNPEINTIQTPNAIRKELKTLLLASRSSGRNRVPESNRISTWRLGPKLDPINPFHLDSLRLEPYLFPFFICWVNSFGFLTSTNIQNFLPLRILPSMCISPVLRTWLVSPFAII